MVVQHPQLVQSHSGARDSEHHFRREWGVANPLRITDAWGEDITLIAWSLVAS